MTDKAILNQIMKLRVTFPQYYKHYGREENVALAKIWQKQFAEVEDGDMIKVVDSFIGSHTFPPSIKELLDELKGLEMTRLVQQQPIMRP